MSGARYDGGPHAAPLRPLAVRPLGLTPDSLSGERVAGRYLLGEQLGSGGAAAVYRARDMVLRVDRAIKVLTAPPAMRAHLRERMQAEARVMATLSHPNVLRVYDVGAFEELDYVVMELAGGGSLHQLAVSRGPLPPTEACGFVLQVLAALAAAHAAGVVHRDVKPQNVLLDGQGTALLADFGIALWQHEEEMRTTRAGVAMGSVAFMAPEQRLDARSVTPTADLYAVGASLYELLTGSNPVDLFSASPESPRWLGLEPPLAAFLQRACAQDPEARFEDARSMAEALLAASRELGLDPARAPDPSDPTRFPVPGNPSALEPIEPAATGSRPTLTPSHTWTPAAATAIDLLFDEPHPPTAAAGVDPSDPAVAASPTLHDLYGDDEPVAARSPRMLLLGTAVALLLAGAAWWAFGAGTAVEPAVPSVESVVELPIEPAPAAVEAAVDGDDAAPDDAAPDDAAPDAAGVEAAPVAAEALVELAPEPLAEPAEAPAPEAAPATSATSAAAGSWKGAYGGRVAELSLQGSPGDVRGTLTVRFGQKALSTVLAGRLDGHTLTLDTVDAPDSEAGVYTATLDGSKLSGTFTQALGGHVNTFTFKRAGP